MFIKIGALTVIVTRKGVVHITVIPCGTADYLILDFSTNYTCINGSFAGKSFGKWWE